MIYKYKCDNNKLNYSQRNNTLSWPLKEEYPNAQYFITWKNMCNVTSMVMAADYAGYSFPKGQYEQPEDNFGKFLLESKEVDEFYRKQDPYSYNIWRKSLIGECSKEELVNCYPPTEIHGCLSYGLNLWLNQDAVEFKTDFNFKKLLFNNTVVSKKPVVVSTKFGGMGHIVCVSGVTYNYNFINEDLTPDSIIVDDPWGKFNPKTNIYDAPSGGNDIIVPWDKALALLKQYDSEIKWAHRFK